MHILTICYYYVVYNNVRILHRLTPLFSHISVVSFSKLSLRLAVFHDCLLSKSGILLSTISFLINMSLPAKLQGSIICPRDFFISSLLNLNTCVLGTVFTLFKSQACSVSKKQLIQSLPATFEVHPESNITDFCYSLKNKQL